MSAERVIANTLRLAKADLDAATLLHVGKNRYAIYHCEQAAEKVIKASTSGNIKPAPDDATLEADMASVNEALLAATVAFGVDLSKQDQPARTAKPPR
jgi:HEPN domain-containing protein